MRLSHRPSRLELIRAFEVASELKTAGNEEFCELVSNFLCFLEQLKHDPDIRCICCGDYADHALLLLADDDGPEYPERFHVFTACEDCMRDRMIEMRAILERTIHGTGTFD